MIPESPINLSTLVSPQLLESSCLRLSLVVSELEISCAMMVLKAGRWGRGGQGTNFCVEGATGAFGRDLVAEEDAEIEAERERELNEMEANGTLGNIVANVSDRARRRAASWGVNFTRYPEYPGPNRLTRKDMAHIVEVIKSSFMRPDPPPRNSSASRTTSQVAKTPPLPL